jgi:hypothetical protein
MAEWCPARKVITRQVVKMPPGPSRFATAGLVIDEPYPCPTNGGVEHRCHRETDHGRRHFCSCGWSWSDA